MSFLSANCRRWDEYLFKGERNDERQISAHDPVHPTSNLISALLENFFVRLLISCKSFFFFFFPFGREDDVEFGGVWVCIMGPVTACLLWCIEYIVGLYAAGALRQC